MIELATKSQDWSNQHRLTIGSSIAAAVCGVHPYMTVVQAYDYMTGIEPPAEMNQHMERGVLLEPIARKKLAQHLKASIEPHDQYSFIYNDRYPFAHALPDGWIPVLTPAADGDGHDRLEIPVELKVPTPQNWQMIRLKGVHDYWLIQCMHVIAITNAPWIEFGALNPVTMQVLPVRVNRDDGLIDSMMEREAAFFEQVRKGQRPTEEQPEAIELPEIGGEMVTLTDDDALAAAAAYCEAEQILKDAEALKESAKSRIEELMAGADVAELPGLRIYNREQAGRITFDKKALAKAHPEIDLNKFEKHGKPFKTFRAYLLGK